jgi:hypothetical protein
MSYDPRIGRWISEDPIGFAGGTSNLTEYVGNEPTNEVDPDGLQARPNQTQRMPPSQRIPPNYGNMSTMNPAQQRAAEARYYNDIALGNVEPTEATWEAAAALNRRADRAAAARNFSQVRAKYEALRQSQEQWNNDNRKFADGWVTHALRNAEEAGIPIEQGQKLANHRIRHFEEVGAHPTAARKAAAIEINVRAAFNVDLFNANGSGDMRITYHRGGATSFRGMFINLPDLREVSDDAIRVMYREGKFLRDAETKLEFHHYNMDPRGPIWIVSNKSHQTLTYNAWLHPFLKANGSGITDAEREVFRTFKEDFIRSHAYRTLLGRGIDVTKETAGPLTESQRVQFERLRAPDIHAD